MLTQFGKVSGGWVAFMLRETIFGIEPVVFEHGAVALDFRDHARGGDAEADAITSNQSRLITGKIRNRQTVDENMGGTRIEFFPSPPHPEMGRAENVQTINIIGGNRYDGATNLGISRDL
jgi:hypothetical protein